MIAEALLSFLPVMVFLAGLQALDTYKLLTPRRVLTALAAGSAAALASYFPNTYGFATWGSEYRVWGAPAVEELAKGLYVLACVATRRVGFPVDAAIAGFAVGTGFALVENLFYLDQLAAGSALAVWLVRGLGTAVMHGGATATAAILAVTLAPRVGVWLAAVPSLLAAWSIHAAYNRGALPPLEQAALILMAVPALLMLIFWQSEKAVARWLHGKLDNDLGTLDAMASGRFLETPAGRYLASLRGTFRPEVVGDMLCLLRLSAELSAKAKAELLQRELGFEPPPDTERSGMLKEMAHLERGIGPMGRRALAPLMPASARDQWERMRMQ